MVCDLVGNGVANVGFVVGYCFWALKMVLAFRLSVDTATVCHANCNSDEGRSLGAADKAEAPNHLKLPEEKKSGDER